MIVSSPSATDQRLRVYVYEDAGADGWSASQYVFQTEVWGRIDDTTGAATTVAGQVEHRAQAVAVLPIHLDVPQDSVIKDVETGRLYRTKAVLLRRQLQQMNVTCELISDDLPYPLVGDPS